MKGNTYKSIVRGNISSNLSKAMISSATPFKITNSMEIVNRVLTLESLILVSDVLYGGDKSLTIHCKSVEETKALEFLVSLSDTLDIEKVQRMGISNCYLVSFTHGATYRSLVIEDEFIKFFFGTFQNMHTSSNFVSMLNDEIDRLIMECYCIDKGVDIAQLKFSLRNKGLSSKFLDLDALVEHSDIAVKNEGTGIEPRDIAFERFEQSGIDYLFDTYKELESKYKGLGNLSKDVFIVDLKDFEVIFRYFSNRYRDYSDGYDTLHCNCVSLSFDHKKVLPLVDSLYMGTYYSELYSRSHSEFSEDMGFPMAYAHKKYNELVYLCLKSNGSNTFELHVDAPFKKTAEMIRNSERRRTN